MDLDQASTSGFHGVFSCGMSRSGTTLLTTVLDSHPDISMGYELLHAGLPSTAQFIESVETAWAEAGDNGRKCGNLLKEWGFRSAGVLVKRCVRTRVDPPELVAILRTMRDRGFEQLDGLEAQTQLAMSVAQAKMAKERTGWCGFKATASSVSMLDRLFPKSRFFLIIRDPRDVVASHRAAGFDRSVRQIARSWNDYGRIFGHWLSAHPGSAALIRYEDLVTAPEPTLRGAFERTGLEFSPEVLRFFDSKASVHRPGQHHVNAENLKKDFYVTSMGRWRRELPDNEVRWIERGCWTLMDRFGYPRRRTRRRGVLARLLARPACRLPAFRGKSQA